MRSQSLWCWVSALALLLVGASGAAAQEMTVALNNSKLPTPEEWNRVTLLTQRLLTHSATLETQAESLNERLGTTETQLAEALRQLTKAEEHSLTLEQLVENLNTQLAASERSRANLQQSRERERAASQEIQDHLTTELETANRRVRRISNTRWVWVTLAAIAGVTVGASL